MNTNVRTIIIFVFLLGILLCVYSIGSGSLTSRESLLLSVLLTVLSILASWIIAHIYSESQYKEALHEVQETHKANLRTYAKKAAEKVNNLSNELGRLAAYMDEELERTDLPDPHEALLSREERITSAVHIVNTLKSVNDTALSDWEGVIGDLLDQQREEKEEQEEEMRALLDRLENVIDQQQAQRILGDNSTEEMQSQINSLRKDVRSLLLNMGYPTVKRVTPALKSKHDVQMQCPKCAAILRYRQREKTNGYKSVRCETCGAKFVSRYRRDQGFILEERRIAVETLECPSCGSKISLELDTLPCSSINTTCEACKKEMKVSRTMQGITVKMPTTPGKPKAVGDPIDEKLLAQVKDLLPEQPWPQGIHRTVASQLGVKSGLAACAIHVLIKKGVFLPQINGVIYEPKMPVEKTGETT